MTQVDIYKYTDITKFLGDRWLSLRKGNERFSLRSLSKNIGFSSHTVLHDVIRGKRRVSKLYARKISIALQLTEDEMSYLDLLINYSAKKDSNDGQVLLEKLNEQARKREVQNTMHTFDDQRIQAIPLCFFILELLIKENIPNNPTYIQRKIIPSYTIGEVERAINLLLDAKMIVKTENLLVRHCSNFVYSLQDVPNIALRIYHQELCRLAMHAVATQKIEDREFNGVCLNVDLNKMNDIKSFLRNFIVDFISRFEATPDVANGTLQVNLHAFRVT